MSLGKTARRIVTGGIAAIVAAPLVMLACAADPINYVDAFDTPAGGLFVNPGVVTCGAVNSGCRISVAECCIGAGAIGACADAAAPTQCPPNAATIGCNETADCTIGSLCCGTPPANGAQSLSAQCATSCPAPQVQLCRTNGECSGDKCVIQQCSDGLVYEMCDHYTSPTFDCTVLGGSASADGAAPDAGDDAASLDATPSG